MLIRSWIGWKFNECTLYFGRKYKLLPKIIAVEEYIFEVKIE